MIEYVRKHTGQLVCACSEGAAGDAVWACSLARVNTSSAAQVQRIVEEAKIIASLSGRVLKLEQKVQAIEVKMGEVEAKQTQFGNSLAQLDVQQRETAADVSELQTKVEKLDVSGFEEELSNTQMLVYALALAVLLLCVVTLLRGRGGPAKSAPIHEHEPFRHTAANASHVEPFLREAA